MKREEQNMQEMTDFFHTVLQKEEVPFDENAWKEAEQLLNKEERKYRGFYFQLGADFLALITIIGFLWSANSYSIVYSPRTANSAMEKPQSLQLDNEQSTDKADITKSTSGKTPVENKPIANHSPAPGTQPLVQSNSGIATSTGSIPLPPNGNNTLLNDAGKPENLSATPIFPLEDPLLEKPEQFSDRPSAFSAQKPKTDVAPMPLATIELPNPDKNILARGFALPKGGPNVFRKGIVAGFSATLLDGRISSRPNIFGGIWGSLLLGRKMEIGGQATYHLSSGGGIYSRTEWIDYGFEQTHTIATVYTKSLHFLEFPLHLGYHAGRTQIIAGIKPSYLVNTTDQLQLEINGELKGTQENSYGYMDGFNRLNFSPFLGIQRILHESYLVGARIEYGATDITKDAFYGPRKDNLLHLKLYLQFIR